ncbi:MAG: hypothetical protein OEZ36_06825, partial [Spirochaetota bacterium]|nr:hypothetical protein [Spirochaetota bacterium]
MKTIISILLFLTMFITANSYSTEVFNLKKPGENHLYFNFEFDPTFAVVLGYSRTFYLDFINRNLTLAVDYTLPIFLLDMKHYRFEFTNRIPLFDSQSWNIVNRFSLLNAGTDNGLYVGNKFSINEGLLLGYFQPKWYSAVEVGFEKNLLTYIEHSDKYKSQIYPNAKDGWYKSTGSKYVLAIQGGYTFADFFELTARVGLQWLE